ncbi:hypothetical protein LAZ67_16001285 [Cordylochernes scorpioides]|uniref:Uncharacterized protein n=1 Tax=Cordylochernes scorpioides TaxID=51811 RepID=A0ABY6LB68_9ARAC|nr:hypothetical protein LAZ67_16001285 [Cordylochernes scorpioides]
MVLTVGCRPLRPGFDSRIWHFFLIKNAPMTPRFLQRSNPTSECKLCRLPPRLHGRVDIEVRLASDMEPNVNTRIRQRSMTEFLSKFGDISATTIHSNLRPVYGNKTLDRSTIQK